MKVLFAILLDECTKREPSEGSNLVPSLQWYPTSRHSTKYRATSTFGAIPERRSYDSRRCQQTFQTYLDEDLGEKNSKTYSKDSETYVKMLIC